MNPLATPQPLADVHKGDYVIAVSPAHQRSTSADDILILYRVTRRTKRRIWIGGNSYRLSGHTTRPWIRDRLRLPQPGEVERLEAAGRLKAAQCEESGHEYRRKRERYISLMYQAALNRDRELFVELLGPWEVGNWDDKLAKLDEINSITQGAR